MKLGWRGVVDVVHVAALAFWLGAIVVTGVTAAVVFPMMRELNPTLPAYSGAADQWLIAGGKVAYAVFGVADWIKGVCAVLVLGTLIAESVGGGWSRARWVAVAALLACLGYNLLVLLPRMTRSIEAYWRNAEVGNVEGAAAARASFDEDHPVATRTMGAMAGLLLLNIGVAGWAGGRREIADSR